MKRILFAVMLLSMVLPSFGTAFAQSDESTVYIIKKGDTLWGLSDRFLKDPHYWPDLWARNPKQITNPHLIFPGQKLLIFPDHIEVAATPSGPSAEAAPPVPAGPEAPPPPEEVVKEKYFTVYGGEGYLLEKGFYPAGVIIATQDKRVMIGEGDYAYTDIGASSGAQAGQSFNIFRNTGTISHPVTSEILGSKIVPTGTLKLTDLEEKTSKALVTNSFMEIKVGDFLMPYHDRRREISLRRADVDLSGYILASQSGVITIGAGDVVFLDLGREQGLNVGNMLYVVRDVQPDQSLFDFRPLGKLPDEVLGAVVVVGAGKNVSTALVVKSIRAIYRGDRVELKKNM